MSVGNFACVIFSYWVVFNYVIWLKWKLSKTNSQSCSYKVKHNSENDCAYGPSLVQLVEVKGCIYLYDTIFKNILLRIEIEIKISQKYCSFGLCSVTIDCIFMIKHCDFYSCIYTINFFYYDCMCVCVSVLCVHAWMRVHAFVRMHTHILAGRGWSSSVHVCLRQLPSLNPAGSPATGPLTTSSPWSPVTSATGPSATPPYGTPSSSTTKPLDAPLPGLKELESCAATRPCESITLMHILSGGERMIYWFSEGFIFFSQASELGPHCCFNLLSRTFSSQSIEVSPLCLSVLSYCTVGHLASCLTSTATKCKCHWAHGEIKMIGFGLIHVSWKSAESLILEMLLMWPPLWGKLSWGNKTLVIKI